MCQDAIGLETFKLIAVHKVLPLLLASKKEHGGAHLLACDVAREQGGK
jgi:hypothetical protein